jgi:hypothetical protein
MPNCGPCSNVPGMNPALFGASPAITYSGLSYAYPFTRTSGLRCADNWSSASPSRHRSQR